MKKLPVLGCALNLSEGRRLEVVGTAADAASTSAAVLDVTSDPDHNRSVLTVCGHPGDLVDAVMKLAAVAVEHIDLNAHQGVHPRTGSVDVVPFYPLRDATIDLAVGAAVDCARRLWEDLRIPSFLYEAAAGSPETAALPWIRKHAFLDRPPDVGGPLPHPTAGAAVVGARGLLVAYNVDLATDDVSAARLIASAIRTRFPGTVRALGLYLPRRGGAQVSMNILAPEEVTLHEVYAAVSEEAGGAGVGVVGSEIIGLVPRACVGAADDGLLKLREKPKVLEDLVERLFAD